jgi:arylsulfatase A-like enzyme
LLEFFIHDAIDLPAVGLRFSGCAIDEDGDPVMNRDRFIDILNHGLSIDPEDGDLDGWKDMLKHYFACCATADRAVGRVLDGLENSPYADHTMVILWSDHGYHLGEKMHVTKFTFWDDGSRVYFIIKDPRNPQSAGQRCYQPVSLVDIYPTVVRMAGLQLPDERITGRDLSPLLEDPGSDRAAPAHTTFRTADSHLVRDDRYKMIRYEGSDSEIELYDMQYDDEEYYNLAEVSGYKPVLEKMKSLLKTALREGKFEGE